MNKRTLTNCAVNSQMKMLERASLQTRKVMKLKKIKPMEPSATAEEDEENEEAEDVVEAKTPLKRRRSNSHVANVEKLGTKLIFVTPPRKKLKISRKISKNIQVL